MAYGAWAKRAISMVGILLSISGCSALFQKPDQVFVRKPGERFLTGPHPVAEEAVKDWEFALLSQAAYCKLPQVSGPTPAGAAVPAANTRATTPVTKPTADDIACQSVDAELNRAGWQIWPGFPDAVLAGEIQKSNLRVEVWTKESSNSVAVAFGGTNFLSGMDWLSNLRWLIPFKHDEYTEIVGTFGPAFVREFARRQAESGGEWLKEADIYSTGHSLGGGLAQQFAYALPEKGNELQRVHAVLAFDPSPVTGYFSVDSATRDHNKKCLSIERIYERGEILALLRSLTSFLSPPSVEDPKIRAVRYNVIPLSDPFWYSLSSHSISELAQRLKIAAGQPGSAVQAIHPEVAAQVCKDRARSG